MTCLSGLLDQRFLKTLALAFIWMLVVRAALILQSGVLPSLFGMIASDLAGAAILAVLLTLTKGPSRVLLVALLGCALYVAGMHLAAHGTLFQLALAGKSADPTFITGSLLNRYLLLLPAYTGLAYLLHRAHRAWVSPGTPPGQNELMVAAVVVIVVYSLSLPSLTTPANNVVASTFAQIPGMVINPIGTTIGNGTVEADNVLDSGTHFFHQQVVASPTAQAPNVLVIMIEGLSGGYFPHISQYHDLEPAFTLKHLETTLKEKGFRLYRNALSMARQTHRGTFAILCGQYPDLHRNSTKLQDVVEAKAVVDCLPGTLRDHGYHTAYWQAAPIEYMDKDAFMPKAGFVDVSGAKAFAGDSNVEGWGPTDPVYFPAMAQRILELDEKNSPWFVTLLNVGTHHPFNIGEESSNQPMENGQQNGDEPGESPVLAPQEARRKAMHVMERALVTFLDKLAAEGILDNTLVVVTSDESDGFVRTNQESVPLNSNIGVLAIRPPAWDSLDRYAGPDRIVAQMDIPLTVLDVTGLGQHAGNMVGRSLLVNNDPIKRDLLLADTYTGIKYFLRETGTLLACTELMTRCSSWAFEPKRLFGSLRETESEPFLTLQQRLGLYERATTLEPKIPP